MTAPNFRALAEQQAGAGWASLEEPARAALVRAAKRAWLEERMGPPAPREDFPTWLAAQAPDAQDRALGADRATRFRAGELAITQFTDPPGRPLTLEQLARTRPEDFTRPEPELGLNPSDDPRRTAR